MTEAIIDNCWERECYGITMVCKNKNCQKEFSLKHLGQVYCSKACAPYGHLVGVDERKDHVAEEMERSKPVRHLKYKEMTR